MDDGDHPDRAKKQSLFFYETGVSFSETPLILETILDFKIVLLISNGILAPQ
jgi:hypothetical protein